MAMTNRRRVVVTGVGLCSPIGNSLDEVSHALQHGEHGIRQMTEWNDMANMFTRLGAPARVIEQSHARQKVRGMGRVGLLALYATEQALADAALDPASLGSGRLGVAYGSTQGSSSALEAFCMQVFAHRDLKGLKASDYIKFMSHTCAANLAIYYGIRGRVLPTCSACTSGSQGIGLAYEAIADGRQDVMICGGAEELHVLHAGVFDLMYATSTRYNDRPDDAPRPFDAARDGLVVGEGAATLILESAEHAHARGRVPIAELIGYGTTCDGQHITSPSTDGMASAMRLALDDAGIDAREVDYVNAHATATEIGDQCESQAMLQVYGDAVPVSSTKGFTGHTLGACGAIESAFCFAMMRDGFLAPNRNLTEVGEGCAPLDYVFETRAARPRIVVNNNFAFAGINTSLVFRAIA